MRLPICTGPVPRWAPSPDLALPPLFLVGITEAQKREESCQQLDGNSGLQGPSALLSRD